MKTFCLRIVLLCALWPGAITSLTAQSYTFSTIAGAPGLSGSADGTNNEARFLGPAGLALDSAGRIYVADLSNHTIRQVTPVGTDWVVTTLAGLARTLGSTDGTNDQARFNRPSSVVVDSAGNLFVTDNYNQTIRKMTRFGTNWAVTTIAGTAGVMGAEDGTGSQARFHGPQAMAMAGDSTIFLTDRLNFDIRQMDIFGTDWVVRTIAGASSIYGGFQDGLNDHAEFNMPFGIARFANGNLYVADFGNNAIRRIAPLGQDWRTTTAAGFAGMIGTNDGPASIASFNSPNGIAVDASEKIYVTDQYNNTLRKLTPVAGSWMVTTLAGAPKQPGSADGPATNARFNRPWGIALDPVGNLFVVDSSNHTLRKGTLEVAPPPCIQIFITGGQIALAWPAAASNFVLHSSAALGTAAFWTPLTNGVVSSGTNYLYFLTNQSGSAAGFFRLSGA